MYKVFVEYKVFPEKREAYLHLMRTMRQKHPQLEVYEATDQESLFVEIWRDCGPEEYRRLKAERTGLAGSDWAALHDMVPGGADRIHIWHFAELPL